MATTLDDVFNQLNGVGADVSRCVQGIDGIASILETHTELLKALHDAATAPASQDSKLHDLLGKLIAAVEQNTERLVNLHEAVMDHLNSDGGA